MVSIDHSSATTEAPGPSPHRRTFGWLGAIGVAVSIVLLWWTLRDVHLPELLEHLSRVNLLLMSGAIIVATVAFPLRTVRWQYMLQIEGKKLPFGPLWHATAIGFMASNILFPRAGEIARPYAAHRLTAVKFTAAAGTIAVERIIDGIVLLALLAGAAALGGFTVDTEIAGIAVGDLLLTGTVVSLAALIAGVLAVLRPDWTLAVARRVLGFALPRRWTEALIGLLEGVFEGLSVLRNPRRFGIVLVWSFIVWGVNGLSFLLAMWAFGFTAPASAAYVLQSIIAFGVAIPSTPGFFGPFEAATRIALSAYGISATEAAAYAAGYHITTFIPITVLGLWSLSRADLRFGDLARRAPSTTAETADPESIH